MHQLHTHFELGTGMLSVRVSEGLESRCVGSVPWGWCTDWLHRERESESPTESVGFHLMADCTYTRFLWGLPTHRVSVKHRGRRRREGGERMNTDWLMQKFPKGMVAITGNFWTSFGSHECMNKIYILNHHSESWPSKAFVWFVIGYSPLLWEETSVGIICIFFDFMIWVNLENIFLFFSFFFC